MLGYQPGTSFYDNVQVSLSSGGGSTPSAPSIAGLTAATDSGTAGDSRTDIPKPSISGTAGANDTITIYLDNSNTALGTTTADNTGKWTYNFASNLSAGAHSITATDTHGANTSAKSPAYGFTIDPVPTAPTLSLSVDTGSSNSDKNTSNPSLTASGAGASAQYSADNGAHWTSDLVALSAGLTEVSKTILARQSDAYGNVSDNSSFAFALDKTAPKASISLVSKTSSTMEATITFTEKVAGFTIDDMSAIGGKLSNFTTVDGHTYKATYTIASEFIGRGYVEIAKSYTDIAGNNGTAGRSADFFIDTTQSNGGVNPGTPGDGVNPPVIPTAQFDGVMASLIVSDLVIGTIPVSAAKLSALVDFTTLQFNAYQARGVGMPELGPYEALGQGFAHTSQFQAKYGSLAEAAFVIAAYNDVFGRQGTAVQQQHFLDQVNYFEKIYATAGIGASQAKLMAEGSAFGQMVGVAVLTEPSLHKYVAEALAFEATANAGKAEYGLPLSHWDL